MNGLTKNLDAFVALTAITTDEVIDLHEKIPNDLCWGCGEKKKVRCCAGCRLGRFCSQQCQKENWKKHRDHCRFLTRINNAWELYGIGLAITEKTSFGAPAVLGEMPPSFKGLTDDEKKKVQVEAVIC